MRKLPLMVLSVLATTALLTACGGNGGGTNKEAKSDDGVIPALVFPAPEEPDALPVGMDAELPAQAKAEDDWLSAPWAIALVPDPDSQDLMIAYVDGDTICLGHAGFTLDETKSKVTVGAYVKRVADKDCPDDPARAFKWGTIKLAQPLGDRELMHTGVDEIYKDFSWTNWVKPAEEEPADDGSSEADESTDDASAGQDEG
jgi:hypothetical protein